MTSRRIESHKNYYEVMRRHQKTSRLKKVFKLLILLIFFLALIFFSYSLIETLTKEDESAKRTFSNTESYYIKADLGDTIITRNGSQIFIPKNAFKLSDGTVFTDTVKISYTEYRNPIEIALAQFEMQLNEGEYLESAGMFSIYSTNLEEETLYPNESEVIKVNLTTPRHDPDFNKYYYNERTKSWVDLGPEEQHIQFMIKANLTDFPEIQLIENIIWTSDDIDFFTDSAFAQVYEWYELKETTSGFHKLSLESLNLQPETKIVTLSYGTDSLIWDLDLTATFDTAIVRLLNPSEDEKVINSFYQSRKFLRASGEDKISLPNNLMSSFYIQKFGVYNIDRPFPFDFITIEPVYITKNSSQLLPSKIIAISDSINTVFRFEPNKIKGRKGSKYTMFYISEDKKLYHGDFIIDSSLHILKLKEKKLKELSLREVTSALGYEYKGLALNDTTNSLEYSQPTFSKPVEYQNKNIIWIKSHLK